MPRRNRKKKQINLFDELRSKFGQLDKRQFLAAWNNLPKFHQKALMVLLPIFVVLLIIPTPEKVPENTDVVIQTERKEVSVDTTDLSSVGEAKQSMTVSDDWREYTVKSGDTLAKVFRANNLSMSDLNELVKIEGLDKPLSKIKVGQLVRYKLTSSGELDILQLEQSNAAVMFFRLSGGGFGRSK